MFDSELLADVAQLHALAAKIAAAVSSDVSGAVADDALREALAAVRQGELATCRLMERVDRTGQFAVDGASSSVAYLRVVANERAQWAAKRVQVGRALTDRLPATAHTWESGLLGLDHASVIDQATRDLQDPEQVAELDRILSAAAAQGLSPADLDQLAERIRAQAAPEKAAQKAERQRREQRVHLSKTLGGRYRLDGWLDAENGLIFSKALAAFMPKPPSAEQALADPAGLEPIAFRRAQALVQLCRHAIDHAEGCHGEGGGRHTVVVASTIDQLRSGIGAGHTEDGATLHAAAIRRLACDAKILPMLLGTDGQVLDVGRQTRTIGSALRHAIAMRDGGCVFPGCDRPPSWCEGHHREHWSSGGETDRDNLDLLCTHHHHLIHEGGWSYRPVDRETLHFYPPSGGPPLISKRRPIIPPPRDRRGLQRDPHDHVRLVS